MTGEARVAIASDVDIVTARQKGRDVASELGFTDGDLTVIAAAISEVARNIVAYAKRGEIVLTPAAPKDGRIGVTVIARDSGPGIDDVRQALQDGYSTSGGFGLGLPGARRLMDEFEIVSEVGKGTVVTMRKWKR
ncbi:MAG: anti-sigma regulatory factor [Gemmatimonadota bacterium]